MLFEFDVFAYGVIERDVLLMCTGLGELFIGYYLIFVLPNVLNISFKRLIWKFCDTIVKII
jgi:hypothetical protein